MKIVIYDRKGKREVEPFTLAADNEYIDNALAAEPQENNS